MRRILYVGSGCYFDDSSGAAVASRMTLEALARHGFAVEALTGTVLERNPETDLLPWLHQRAPGMEASLVERWTVGPGGLTADLPRHFRLTVQGVPVTLHESATTKVHTFDDAEIDGFLRLYEIVVARFRPDVLVNFGGDALAKAVRSRAQALGIAVVFPLHNFNYPTAEPFLNTDAVFTPSRFAAAHYRQTIGLTCHVLPNLIDPGRVVATARSPQYLTFVNPSFEKGVYAFARIADELGRRRPDIPLLVVEGRGSERTLADCGLDLRVHGNVSLMSHTHDPRMFWSVTKVCLMSSLWWENQPLVTIEALVNGVPVVGSDRGGIPETLGDAGIVLPLPDRLTPATRSLPTAEEVAPWVEAVIRLWDDDELYADHQRRALAEARRWAPEVLEPQYVRFFDGLRPGGR